MISSMKILLGTLWFVTALFHLYVLVKVKDDLKIIRSQLMLLMAMCLYFFY